MSSMTSEADELPRRRLPMWVALSLSVATVGPTLAMAGNGQGAVGSAAKTGAIAKVIARERQRNIFKADCRAAYGSFGIGRWQYQK